MKCWIGRTPEADVFKQNLVNKICDFVAAKVSPSSMQSLECKSTATYSITAFSRNRSNFTFKFLYRAMAVSLTFASGECGSTLGSFIFGFLLQSQCAVAFYFFGGVLLSKYLLNTTSFACVLNEVHVTLLTVGLFIHSIVSSLTVNGALACVLPRKGKFAA